MKKLILFCISVIVITLALFCGYKFRVNFWIPHKFAKRVPPEWRQIFIKEPQSEVHKRLGQPAVEGIKGEEWRIVYPGKEVLFLNIRLDEDSLVNNYRIGYTFLFFGEKKVDYLEGHYR
jgi:hypothetical protein